MLRVEDIHSDATGTWIQFRTAGNKLQELELPMEASKAIQAWLQLAGIRSGPIFPNRQTTGSIHPVTVNKIVNRRAAEAGVKTAISPRQFRAAVGKLLYAELAAGTLSNEQEIQTILGHSRASTSRRYSRGSAIQEELLFVPASESGRDAITLREMRTVCAVVEWAEQRERWEGHASHRMRLGRTSL